MGVKCHRKLLPCEFMLPLIDEIFANLRLQFATSRLNFATWLDAEEFDLGENQARIYEPRLKML